MIPEIGVRLPPRNIMTQTEALQIAVSVLVRRADTTTSSRSMNRLLEAVDVLQRMEALYDPDNDAWKITK